MIQLLNGTITFEYTQEYFPNDNIPAETLVIKNGDEMLFSGFDVGATSVIDELSNMATAIIDGQHEYSVAFADEDYDGSVLGFLKGGRILYEYGPGFCKIWYTDAKQLRDLIISFLQFRADRQLTCGNLETAVRKLKKIENTLINDNLPFSFSLKHHRDFRRITDRLRVQWGDFFFFADSAGTNIIQALLDSAIDLLNNKNSTQVHIDDDNFDSPAEENTSTYYRNFDLFLKRSKRNPLILHITITEQPWREETILVSVEEYLEAVDTLVTDVLASTSIEAFNEIHENYDRQILFPEITYRKFKELLDAYRDADESIDSPK